MKSSNEEITKGLIVQLISMIILMILVIVAFINKQILPYADLMAALTFFIMAYNKRKNKIMLILLPLCGTLFIAIAIWSLLHG